MEVKTNIVNEKDEIIGQISESEAHKNKNVITRAAAVFLFNSKGELLLQKRSKNKFRFPLYWTCSASGFVDQGETYIDAALRELNEELGIKVKNQDLVFLFKKLLFIDIKHMVSVYKVIYDAPINFLNPEVEKAEFFPEREIRKLISSEEKFTPFFLELFEELKS